MPRDLPDLPPSDQPGPPDPTERELAILKVLWADGEASVRGVYDALKDELPIVQNTVQAFLRTMEAKGLVTHRTEGRTFLYRPVQPREPTSRNLVSGLLDRVFDGAVDELVGGGLARLRRLVEAAEAADAPPADDTPKEGER